MRRRNIVISLALTGLLTIGTFVTAFASSNEVVTLGANLTEQQRQEMFQEFGVKASDVKVINMTVQDIRKQLGLPPAPANVKGNAYSSAFVRVEEPGYGIKVKTKNLTAVTPEMLSNALLTSGVTDADVYATAPFEVTGTSALAGVIQAFEDATGKEIPEKNKQVARQEISITDSLSQAKTDDGKEIGKTGAATIVNDAKKEVIKEKPKNDREVGKIVNGVAKDYNVQLTPEQQEEFVKLMSEVNSLNLNYKELKGQLDSMTDKLNTALKQGDQVLKENGAIQKSLEKVKSLLQEIKAWLVTHLSDNNVTQNGVQYDRNGNLIDSNKDNTNQEQDSNNIDQGVNETK